MSVDDVIPSLFAVGGFLLGVYLATPESIALIEECEATLPRDQQCVLIAVPPEEQADE